jgi:hypothetical protein
MILSGDKVTPYFQELVSLNSLEAIKVLGQVELLHYPPQLPLKSLKKTFHFASQNLIWKLGGS